MQKIAPKADKAIIQKAFREASIINFDSNDNEVEEGHEHLFFLWRDCSADERGHFIRALNDLYANGHAITGYDFSEVIDRKGFPKDALMGHLSMGAINVLLRENILKQRPIILPYSGDTWAKRINSINDNDVVRTMY